METFWAKGFQYAKLLCFWGVCVFLLYNMRAELVAVNQVSDAGSELKYTNVFLEKNLHVGWLQR